MTTRDETDRNALGRVICAMRPDWDVIAVKRALLDLADKPYLELALAFVTVAADPKSQTPARVTQNGHWWKAVEQTRPTPADRHPCRRCGNVHTPDDKTCQYRDPATAHAGAETARAALRGGT